MAKRKVKLVLLKTVVHKGKYFWPDSVVEWDPDVAEDLIERQAAEPCTDVVPFPGDNREPGGGSTKEER